MNRLFFIKKIGKIKNLYRCFCGKEKIINKYNVKYGFVSSCGCLHIEKAREMGKNRRKYSIENSKLMRTFYLMHDRCENVKNISFKYYGAKGIKVCKRWSKFINFCNDMGTKPTSAHSLGRIDNDKGYQPSNCRWETAQQQASNTSRNIYFKGMTMSQWARKLNVSKQLIEHRMKTGWPIEKACSLPKFSNIKKLGRPKKEFDLLGSKR